MPSGGNVEELSNRSAISDEEWAEGMEVRWLPSLILICASNWATTCDTRHRLEAGKD